MPLFTIYGYSDDFAHARMISAGSLESATEKAAAVWPGLTTGAVMPGTPLPAEFTAAAEYKSTMRQISGACQPSTYQQKCADRIAAHRNKCRENVIAALPTIHGHTPPSVERIAERIESEME
jgi:hypothetical protein